MGKWAKMPGKRSYNWDYIFLEGGGGEGEGIASLLPPLQDP